MIALAFLIHLLEAGEGRPVRSPDLRYHKIAARSLSPQGRDVPGITKEHFSRAPERHKLVVRH
jgi:hypothetical protein